MIDSAVRLDPAARSGGSIGGSIGGECRRQPA
jgi:hypothetical protein